MGGHGVVIVGWDDTTTPPCGIIKNSWGSGWGESGYFRIKRGDSDIGSYAAFLDYDNTPPPPPEYANSSTPLGVVFMLASFVLLVTLVYRRKLGVPQPSRLH